MCLLPSGRPNYYWTATPSSATGCRHPTVDASISIWMAPGHLHGDSLRSTPGIHYWMRVHRRCGCSGRARPCDRSVTARPFAPDSTFHRPASPGRGLPPRRRRRVTRRCGRGRSVAVAVPNRVRRRGAPRFFEPLLPYWARSCFVPFWPGLRCSRTRDAEGSDRRRGGVARSASSTDVFDEAR